MSPTVRLRLDLAYDGTDFHGWARQPSLRTVQGELERALATVLRTPVTLTCAGRTDTGVHARGQVAHLDVDPDVLEDASRRSTAPPAEALLPRLAGVLPGDIVVTHCCVAEPGFDARFSALWRRYAYRIVDDPACRDPLTRHTELVWSRPLDVEAMRTAASGLVGLRDFAAFCKPREGATTVRTLLELGVGRPTPGRVGLRVVADAFCHNMVRALTGGLIRVGEGRLRPEVLGELLAAGVRDPRVPVVPAHGLTLEEVAYPDAAELLAQATRSRSRREVTS
ncbi:MAG: tRNA pseudouridine(38-40) synthase TruA [Nocardioidaceae bacterium]